MKRLRTVFVDRDGTKVMINESSFDPKKDTLWSDEPKKVTKKKTSKKAAKK